METRTSCPQCGAVPLFHPGACSECSWPEPIVLEMQTWRERNCWARWPRLASDRRSWHGGTSGHCATWYCRTPWGAAWGAWKLHNLTKPLSRRAR